MLFAVFEVVLKFAMIELSLLTKFFKLCLRWGTYFAFLLRFYLHEAVYLADAIGCSRNFNAVQ